MKQKTIKLNKIGTNTRDSQGERFSRLAAMGEQVFHAGDLANLWNIRNSSTLHMTLSRYVGHGLLYRIQNGLYSIKNPSDLDPRLVGLKVLHGPAYVSCETILFDAGIINQPPHVISIVSGVSRQFALTGNHFRSRKLADSFLHNEMGIETKNGVRVATVPRAVADMLYFNAKKHFDTMSAIPWNEVRDIVHAIGYPLFILKRYDTSQ